MDIRGVIRVFLTSLVVVGSTVAIQTAQATPLCPSVGASNGCAIVIQWDGGNFTTSSTGQPSYDSTDGDSLVGIQNNSKDKTLSYVSLTGSNLFGFDQSGIQNFGVSVDQSIFPSNYIMTGYEGPMSYFSGIDANKNNGMVNFIGGLAPTTSTYFALEGAPQTVCPNNDCGFVQGGASIPEPGTVLLMGAGLIGLGVARTRKA